MNVNYNVGSFTAIPGATGMPQFGPTAAAVQASFDQVYAQSVVTNGIGAGKELAPELVNPVTIDDIIGKINPGAAKGTAAAAADIILNYDKDKNDTAADEAGAEPTGKKKGKKKDDTEPKKEKLTCDFNVKSRSILPVCDVTSYFKSTDLEKAAKQVFGKIFADFIGARVHSIVTKGTDKMPGKTVIGMELQFRLTNEAAPEGKIKNVIPATEELNLPKAKNVNENTDAKIVDMINTFKSGAVINNLKSEIKLNNDTREILANFISPNVCIRANDGRLVPDWSRLETAHANTVACGNNQFTVGEQIICVKIDPVIFTSKIMASLEAVNPKEFAYELGFFAFLPADYGNAEFYSVQRFNEFQSFMIELKQTSVKERDRVMRECRLGKYSPYACGPYYSSQVRY